MPEIDGTAYPCVDKTGANPLDEWRNRDLKKVEKIFKQHRFQNNTENCGANDERTLNTNLRLMKMEEISWYWNILVWISGGQSTG
ncbi:hypothetical protein CEXT_52731 [Caerostris extrusa]|uniref:Uncharacterized protein n=1 Tax=Caerostris extrusa TaxID=172846 RepID=A0AAV4TTC9_CAEEX|nr:hypothetical protein CEXT_52731 [Caerostris extrusa]